VDLNTYRSGAAPDVYVTMPSAEAAALFAVVDKLVAMRLAPIRCGYTISHDERDVPFREYITTEIAASGYAVHGFDSAFMGAEPYRRPSGPA